MKILFVIPAYSIGGTLSSLMSLLEIIKDEDYDISFFAISPDGPYRERLSQYGKVIGGKQNSENKQLFSLSLIIRTIKRLLERIGIEISPIVFKQKAKSLERNGYDIVIGFQEGYSTHLISFFKHTYTIAWVHCDYQSYLHLSNRKPEKECYKRIKKVVCVSKYTLEQFQSCIQHPNATYLYNIILDESIRIKSKLDVETGLFPRDKFCIVSVGRFHPVKQFNLIPGIISSLKKRGVTDFVWYLIGGGNETEREIIEKEKERYHAEELILLGEKTNPYAYMAKADLYVCTSKSEACPYAINESKILGVPIVSTIYGSVFEFIPDRQYGLVCPVEGLPEIIERVIKDTDLYNSIKENLKGYVYPNDIISCSLKKDILTN